MNYANSLYTPKVSMLQKGSNSLHKNKPKMKNK